MPDGSRPFSVSNSKHCVKLITQHHFTSAEATGQIALKPRIEWHVIRKTSCVNQIVKIMLRWTITFLVIALIAAVFGFTGIAAGAAEIAKIIFYIFLVFFVISLITGAFRRTE